VTGSTFQSQLVRGLALHLTHDSTVLDDPEVVTRGKFVVILNHYCPDDPMYFVMATSNVGRFAPGERWASDGVSLDPSAYDFLDRPTVLDFTGVKALSLLDLTTLYSKGLATVCDLKRLRQSRVHQVGSRRIRCLDRGRIVVHEDTASFCRPTSQRSMASRPGRSTRRWRETAAEAVVRSRSQSVIMSVIMP